MDWFHSKGLSDSISGDVPNAESSTHPKGDSMTSHEDDSVVKEIEKQIEKIPNRSSASIVKNNEVVSMDVSGPETLPDEGSQLNHDNDDIPESMVVDVVSIKKTYLSDSVHQHSELSVYDDDMGKVQDLRVLSDEAAENATVLYVASEYQKDKIWLRQTRPNKLDYQVVIAVDDSRSMSESCCGDVALVTVCRAMLQLKLGNLAVASFGKKGNTRLLHDFDRPFNGDAGVKETCYEGSEVKFTNYMESLFPFPYYIVLRNIEALPRTPADLLRQWFELMQQRRD